MTRPLRREIEEEKKKKKCQKCQLGSFGFLEGWLVGVLRYSRWGVVRLHISFMGVESLRLSNQKHHLLRTYATILSLTTDKTIIRDPLSY